MLAPLAVIEVDEPVQIDADTGVTVSTGIGFTVIVWFAVPEQPEVVPVIVYIVVTVGEAVTVAPVLALRLADGLQV